VPNRRDHGSLSRNRPRLSVNNLYLYEKKTLLHMVRRALSSCAPNNIYIFNWHKLHKLLSVRPFYSRVLCIHAGSFFSCFFNGLCHEISCLGFFHESSFSGLQNVLLAPFKFFSKTWLPETETLAENLPPVNDTSGYIFPGIYIYRGWHQQQIYHTGVNLTLV
jgi:hypothetical protein